VQEGMKYVAAGMNPMDLKRGIDQAEARERSQSAQCAVLVCSSVKRRMQFPCSTLAMSRNLLN